MAFTLFFPATAATNVFAASGTLPRFEPATCPFTPAKGQAEGSTVVCGFAVVPEVHANPGGPTIRIAVAWFKSQNPTPAAEPIIYLEGGPGAPSLDGGLPNFAARFTQQHDFVAFDQRGVGLSQPKLNCPETDDTFNRDEAKNLDIGTSLGDGVAALWACRDRLVGQGVNLSAYSTVESAADVNDIRAVLGYRKVKLLGISYGTRLALSVMRQFPQIVHSSVIDGVSPPQVDQYATYAVGYDRALKLMFSSCAADPACNAAFPTLQEDFPAAVARLNAQPLTLTNKSGSATLIMNGWRFVSLVFVWLYDADQSRYLPLLITQTKNGESSILRAVYGRSSGGRESSTSDAMAYSVRCSEYTPFSSSDAVTAAAQTILPVLQTEFLPTDITPFTICSQWPIAPPSPVVHQVVTSDLPTLVMESGNDPVTPPSSGQSTAQALSHSFYIESPGVGHSVIGNSGECGLGVALAFFGAPDTKPDTTCISSLGIHYRTELPA
jgi:pimeloyl-ACP methyl ester carboxylesterase